MAWLALTLPPSKRQNVDTAVLDSTQAAHFKHVIAVFLMIILIIMIIKIAAKQDNHDNQDISASGQLFCSHFYPENPAASDAERGEPGAIRASLNGYTFRRASADDGMNTLVRNSDCLSIGLFD